MTERSFFESIGYQVIDDYLNASTCEELLEIIATYRKHHELPEIYRPMKGRSLRYYVIDGKQIKKHLSRIWRLYKDGVNPLVNQLTNKQFLPLENIRAGVNVNIMPPNRSEYRWHYDRTTITAILYLNDVEGGETELYPNYRILLSNTKYMTVQRILDGFLHLKILRDRFGEKTQIKPRQGRLVIMRGNRCWHSVRSVRGENERINIILAYDLPGVQLPFEKSLDSYLYTQEKQTSTDPNYG